MYKWMGAFTLVGNLILLGTYIAQGRAGNAILSIVLAVLGGVVFFTEED